MNILDKETSDNSIEQGKSLNDDDDQFGYYDDEKPRKPKGKRIKKFKRGADERASQE